MTIEAPPYPASLPALTSLRFFAAMVVVIHHFGYFTPYHVEEFTLFLRKGYLAVDFFFILSGFILTHAYTKALLQGKFDRYGFLLRRFARIYPAHAVMLLVMAFVAATPLHFGPIKDWPGSYPWDMLMHNVLLIQGWGIDDTLGFNIPSWSISAEWFAYLLFPFLLPLCVRLNPTFLMIMATLIYAVMWFTTNYINDVRPLTEYTNDFSMIRIMPAFLLGMALYRYKNAHAPNGHAGLGMIAYALIAAFFMHQGFIDIIVIPCLAFLVIWGADLSRLNREGWLAHPLSIWLGEISYSLYMVHYPVMVLILYSAQIYLTEEAYRLAFWGLAPLSFAVSLIAAAALYYYVEVPARRWITGRHQV